MKIPIDKYYVILYRLLSLGNCFGFMDSIYFDKVIRTSKIYLWTELNIVSL